MQRLSLLDIQPLFFCAPEKHLISKHTTMRLGMLGIALGASEGAAMSFHNNASLRKTTSLRRSNLEPAAAKPAVKLGGG
jgi:hypothetical protein